MVVEINKTTPASLRAVFYFEQSRQVRIELDIDMTGGDHSEDHLTEITRILDSSRYHQRLDPDCRECEMQQVLNLIWRCHDQAKVASRRLITSIRIEEGEGLVRGLPGNIMLAESATAKVM
jgi:hypothetical protein